MKLDRFIKRSQEILEKLTKAAGFLVLVIAFAIAVQIVARQGFNKFLVEIVPIIEQSFAVLLMIGGLYVASKGMHIRVTLLSDLFGPKTRCIFKIVNLVCMSIFMGVMIWQTTWMGLNSFANRETMNGIYKFMPMYPLKIFIPIMATLVFLAGLVHLIGTWREK